MASFPLFDLHQELREELILKKMDAVELCRMRACSKDVRQQLSAPGFVTMYNEDDKESRVGYSFVHIQDDVLAPIGDVHGFRWDDKTIRRLSVMDVGDLLMDDVEHGDILTLLFCCKSNFLFLRVREGEATVLVAVDFVTQVVRIIPCPPPLVAANFTDMPCSISMLMRPDEMGNHFRILHVLIHEETQLPHLSVFDSEADDIDHQGWYMVSQVAQAPAPGIQLDPNEHHLMILAHGDHQVFFVTLQQHHGQEVPLFLRFPVNQLFAYAAPLPMGVIDVPDHWYFRARKYFAPGNQGWAAVIISHERDGRHVIKDVSLFQFDPDQFTYRHKASFGGHLLPPNQTYAIRGVFCEATNKAVQVGLVINHGLYHWSTRCFLYRIDSREWSHLDNPHTMATWHGLPRLTSRPTII